MPTYRLMEQSSSRLFRNRKLSHASANDIFGKSCSVTLKQYQHLKSECGCQCGYCIFCATGLVSGDCLGGSMADAAAISTVTGLQNSDEQNDTSSFYIYHRRKSITTGGTDVAVDPDRGEEKHTMHIPRTTGAILGFPGGDSAHSRSDFAEVHQSRNSTTRRRL